MLVFMGSPNAINPPQAVPSFLKSPAHSDAKLLKIGAKPVTF